MKKRWYSNSGRLVHPHRTDPSWCYLEWDFCHKFHPREPKKKWRKNKSPQQVLSCSACSSRVLCTVAAHIRVCRTQLMGTYVCSEHYCCTHVCSELCGCAHTFVQNAVAAHTRVCRTLCLRTYECLIMHVWGLEQQIWRWATVDTDGDGSSGSYTPSHHYTPHTPA